MLTASSLVAKDVTLTQEDNGKSIFLELEDTLHVELEGNKTTGFTWEATSQETSCLESFGSYYTPFRIGCCGSAGLFSFKFCAVTPGLAELKFIYSREWEKNIPSAKEFNVFITVEEKKENQ